MRTIEKNVNSREECQLSRRSFLLAFQSLVSPHIHLILIFVAVIFMSNKDAKLNFPECIFLICVIVSYKVETRRQNAQIGQWKVDSKRSTAYCTGYLLCTVIYNYSGLLKMFKCIYVTFSQQVTGHDTSNHTNKS